MAKSTLRALTLEEHRAIREYGNKYGHLWKTAIRDLWMSANPTTDTETTVYCLRNTHGPRWLSSFTMADARKAVFLAEADAATARVEARDITLPGAENVRDQEIATPEFTAEYSLTPPVSERRAKQEGLF